MKPLRQEIARRYEASAWMRLAVIGVACAVGLVLQLAIPHDLSAWIGAPLLLVCFLAIAFLVAWLVTPTEPYP